MQQRGFVVASARILKRAWQVYVAHVFMFVIFMAEIAYLTRSIENPLYTEEMGALDFLQAAGRHADPGAAAEVQADIHGRAAALHRAAARISAGALAAAARADGRARRIGRCSIR